MRGEGGGGVLSHQPDALSAQINQALHTPVGRGEGGPSVYTRNLEAGPPVQHHGDSISYRPQAHHVSDNRGTLYNAAALFGVSAEQILAANPQINDPNAELAADAQVNIPIAPDGTGPQFIEVGSGESLTSIAQQHGTTVEALTTLNPQIANTEMVYPGEQVLVPGSAPTELNYAVQQGDTLAGIAIASGSTVHQIATANNISMLDTPAAGQTLKIPVNDFGVIPGDGRNPEAYQYYHNVSDQYLAGAKGFLMQHSTLPPEQQAALLGEGLSHQEQRELIYSHNTTKSATELGLSEDQAAEFRQTVDTAWQANSVADKARSAEKKAKTLGVVMDIVSIGAAVFTGGASLTLGTVAKETAKHFAVKALAKESGTLGQIAGTVLSGQVDFSSLGSAALDIGTDYAKDYAKGKLAEEGGTLGTLAGQVLFDGGNFETLLTGGTPDYAGALKNIAVSEVADELGIDPTLVSQAVGAFTDGETSFGDAFNSTVVPILKDVALDEIVSELGLDPTATSALIEAVAAGDGKAIGSAGLNLVTTEVADQLGLDPKTLSQFVDTVLDGDADAISAQFQDTVVAGVKGLLIDEVAEQIGVQPEVASRIIDRIAATASGDGDAPTVNTLVDLVSPLVISSLAEKLDVPKAAVEAVLKLINGDVDATTTPPINPHDNWPPVDLGWMPELVADVGK